MIVIRLYQKSFSPDHGWFKASHPGGFCRFQPTCSQYTYDAIEKNGVIKGIIQGGSRILRCNPWSAGGFDPAR